MYLFWCVWMLYLNVCTYTTWEPVTRRGPKRESDPLELKLKQAFVSNLIQPSTEPGSSSRVVSVPNWWAIFPDPDFYYFILGYFLIMLEIKLKPSRMLRLYTVIELHSRVLAISIFTRLHENSVLSFLSILKRWYYWYVSLLQPLHPGSK